MNTFVIAGSYSEFYYSKYHVEGYTYISEHWQLQGRRNYKVICTGTYLMHRNWKNLYLLLKMQDAEIIYD